MSEKYCARCGINPVESPDVVLCTECINKRLNYSDFYYDTWDLSRKMGVTERTIRRKARNWKLPRHVPGIKRYLWPKSEVDRWLGEGQPPIPRTPASPLQEKAFAMCQRHDHSWMAEDMYAGNSYIQETKVETRQYHINVGSVRICYFCGYKEYFYF